MDEYHTDSPTIPKKRNKRSTFFAMCTTHYSSLGSRPLKIRYHSSTHRKRFSE